MTSLYPSEEDFRTVFAHSSYWLSKSQKRMVRLLLCASSQTMTATEMAAALGYDSYRVINVQFGSLADKVAMRMKYAVPAGDPRASAMIIFRHEGPEEHWRWTMRPELAQALKSLGWKCPSPPVSEPEG